MSEDDKIKQFEPRKAKMEFYGKRKKVAEVKEFLGFEYVKLKKDANGFSFNKKSLRDFANELNYTISVMRETKNGVFLYEYFISGTKLQDFLNACFDGKIEGEIIQITKCAPENLA